MNHEKDSSRIESRLLDEAYELQLEQKGVAEEAAAYDMLVSEVSASREIDQITNYLLAFNGATAAIALINIEGLAKLFGDPSLTLGLLFTAVAGSCGLGARLLSVRLHAFLRIHHERRVIHRGDETTRREENRRIVQLLSERLSDEDLVSGSFVRDHLQPLVVDLDVAVEHFRREYASTLGRVGRWRMKKQISESADHFAHVRRLLKTQHWQRRLVIAQAVLTLGMLAAAALALGVQELP